MTTPIFFPTPAEFREWLRRHHAASADLQVGFYTRASGRPSLTWPESVDEALCCGWIDGVRRNLDEASYQIRFTPRKPGSTWSRVNIAKAEALIAAGRMRPAGLAAYRARKGNRSGIYSYEQRPAELVAPYDRLFRKHRTAWRFFRAQSPSYRRTATWWIVSAKQEATRLRRLEKLIAHSARGEWLPAWRPTARAKSATASRAR